MSLHATSLSHDFRKTPTTSLSKHTNVTVHSNPNPKLIFSVFSRDRKLAHATIKKKQNALTIYFIDVQQIKLGGRHAERGNLEKEDLEEHYTYIAPSIERNKHAMGFV